MNSLQHKAYGSPSFKRVAQGLIALHRLIKTGQEDSPEADAIRDAMDTPWLTLSDSEKGMAQWLSEDLYSISESTPPSHNFPLTQDAARELLEARDAQSRGDWTTALTLLRKWRHGLPQSQVSYQRGQIWKEAGVPEIATVFFEHAAEHEPENTNFQAIYLHSLLKSNPSLAQAHAKEVLAEAGRYPPVVIAHAADIRFNGIKELSEVQIQELCLELIPILERSVQDASKEISPTANNSVIAMLVVLLGICHECLEEISAAVKYYSQAILFDPNNDSLLVARGILSYNTSPHAISDLRRAVQLNSSIVWPYLLLAHHYLSTSQFDLCRKMCERGFDFAESEIIKSQLEEWRAISQAETGFSTQAVRVAFESAIRFNPANESAQRNALLFEESLTKPSADTPLDWEKRTATDMRRQGIAEHSIESFSRQFAFAA